MPRAARFSLASFAVILVALALVEPRAFAQPFASAAPSASDASAAPSASVVVLAPQAAPTASDDRPARGPAIHDRGAPRSRAGATARGALFLVVLVVVAGYWVMKRVRRRF